MPITDYADSTQVAGLVEGIETAQIAAAWMTDANQMIDTLLGYSLASIAVTDEYYNIHDFRQPVLILNKRPIISLTEIIDNAQASSPTTVTLTDLLLDTLAGIIRFKDPLAIDSSPYYFTQGHQTVKASYVWGYNTVPIDIEWLANLWVARHAQHWIWQQDFEDDGIPDGGFKSLKMGRFSVTLAEATDEDLGGQPTRYDKMILTAIQSVKSAYADDLHLLSTESIGMIDPPSDPATEW